MRAISPSTCIGVCIIYIYIWFLSRVRESLLVVCLRIPLVWNGHHVHWIAIAELWTAMQNEKRNTEIAKGRGKREKLVSAGRRENVQSTMDSYANDSRYVFYSLTMMDSCDVWFMAWLPEIRSTLQTLFDIWIMILATENGFYLRLN